MSDAFDHNRAILCHFDSYSALLLFARFGSSLLLPEPAPEAATGAVQASPTELHDPARVRNALVERYGLTESELLHLPQFEAWLDGTPAPLRVHLFRVKSFSPPAELIERHEGKWKPVSELRGIFPHELGYARRIFELIMGGG